MSAPGGGMRLEDQVRAIDRVRLTDLAGAASVRAPHTLTDWTCETLQAPTGTDAGVYRFTGTGGAVARPSRSPGWSVILKVLHPPQLGSAVDGAAGPLRDYWSAPAAWCYWRREAFVYGSGLLDGLSGGLGAPRCYGVDAQPDGTVWLWLEAVVDAYRRRGWPWPRPRRHLLTTHHLGELGGAYLVRRPAPAAPWLSRGDARYWIENAAPRGLARIADAATWRHPIVRAAFPVPVADRLLRLWAERERFLAALARLPQTYPFTG